MKALLMALVRDGASKSRRQAPGCARPRRRLAAPTHILSCGFAVVLLVNVGNAAAQVLPAGPEFAVGTYTTTYPHIVIGSGAPAVGVGPEGEFVVVWSRYTLDYGTNNTLDVFGQRFSAAGTPLGDEVRINTGNTHRAPAMAVEPTGEFVVAWQNYVPYRVYGARYDAARLGNQFAVSMYTTYQESPAVAADPMGGFVVVWSSQYQDGSDFGVFGQRYDAAGTPAGSEFAVNTYTTGNQTTPAVASDETGGFVVVWASSPYGYPLQQGVTGIFGQRYDAAGTPLGGEFAVNTYTTGSQAAPAVASAPTGGFVVVWQSEYLGDDAHVSGRRFDASGSAVGGEFAVGTHTTYRQVEPAVAVDPLGGFLVVWTNEAPDRSRSIVLGQQYDAAGVPVGGEFTFGGNRPRSASPAVAADPTGGFVVVWTAAYDILNDAWGPRVFGQRMTPAGTPDGNIAPDADFEADPASFYFGRGPCSFGWADDVAHSPSHALRIDSQTSELCRWLSEISTIPVDPGESYDVSAWMRTEGSQPAAVLSVKFWTAAGVYIPRTIYAPMALSGRNDWTRLGLSTTAPPDAAFLRIELRLNGPGTLWVDDVRVTAGDPVAKSPPVVKGRLEEGQTVRTTLGSWTGTPSEFQVQWIACSEENDHPHEIAGHPPVCEEILGATETSYTLTAAEVGKSMQTVVRASRSERTGEAFSARRGPVLEAPPSSGNIARDADIELDPAPYFYSSGPCFFDWSRRREFHSATHVLRVSSAASALCRWFTKPTLIAVKPGAHYRVSAWFWADGVQGNGRLGLNYWTREREYIAPTILSSRMVKGTQDWTLLQAEATAPPDAAYLRVELRLNGPGTLLIDDLSVTR